MLLDGLLVLIVAAHLMAVGLAAGGPAVALWLGRREARNAHALAGDAGRWLLRWSQGALLAGALLGAAAVALLWCGYREPYFAAAAQVRVTRYWFGLVELVFTFACFGVGLFLWQRDAAASGPSRRWLRQAVVFLGALNLVYHFPPLFAVIGVFSTRPELQGRNLSYLQLLADSEVLARTLHFLLASLVVTGAGLMVYAAGAGSAAGAPDRARAAVWGGRIALGAAALELLSGLWLLVELPVEVRERLLGQDMAATGCLGLSVVATVGLLHVLAAAGWGDTNRRLASYAAAIVALIVVLMVAARHRGRKEEFERKQFSGAEAGASTYDRGAVIYNLAP